MTAKQELCDIIERLNDEEAALWLEAIQAGDPVLLAALLAPIDDEPETVEEREAVVEARADYAAGRVKTMGQVRRELPG
jgi:hypothetical protein